jgi:hypothetical protein
MMRWQIIKSPDIVTYYRVTLKTEITRSRRALSVIIADNDSGNCEKTSKVKLKDGIKRNH